jgi:hypothetical protein
MKYFEMMKDWLWIKCVDISYRHVMRDFDLAFVNRDKEILDMGLPERQQFYARCHEADDGGAVKAELEALMREHYRSGSMDDLSPAERTSRKYVILESVRLLKRLHDLGSRSKAPSSDAPLDKQLDNSKPIL